MKKQEIKQINIESLIPYARNSRTHSDDQIAQIAASIKEFGFTNPVLIDKENGIIAGHGRVLAARKLGLEEVPCIELSHLSDTQKRAYIIADNKLALNSGWDEDMLRIELEELKLDDFDVDLLGFDEGEIGGILREVEELDEMPELPSGDKPPFQQITFTLHDSQAEEVQRALSAAKATGPFIDSHNENSNGNALARICETFLTQHGDS